ncbi:MAG: hypothetical protein J6O51_01920 [Bacteroidales bacterium]|nr:hypothetical protein [Bacteroidales bacterium]
MGSIPTSGTRQAGNRRPVFVALGEAGCCRSYPLCRSAPRAFGLATEVAPAGRLQGRPPKRAVAADSGLEMALLVPGGGYCG